MTWGKRIADTITFLRLFVAPLLIWLGIAQGKEGLELATLLVLVAWTGDTVDGHIARASGTQVKTWLGEHDGQIDMTICTALAIYMIISGLVNLPLGVVYLLVFAVVFLRRGYGVVTGQVYMAPIWGYFLIILLRNPSPAKWWVLGWLGAATVLNWKRFAKDLAPGFIDGMRDAWQRLRHSGG
jgi:phosphatidylglycerophosphate synthase